LCPQIVGKHDRSSMGESVHQNLSLFVYLVIQEHIYAIPCERGMEEHVASTHPPPHHGFLLTLDDVCFLGCPPSLTPPLCSHASHSRHLALLSCAASRVHPCPPTLFAPAGCCIASCHLCLRLHLCLLSSCPRHRLSMRHCLRLRWRLNRFLQPQQQPHVVLVVLACTGNQGIIVLIIIVALRL
jgi:hypothetical protein